LQSPRSAADGLGAYVNPLYPRAADFRRSRSSLSDKALPLMSGAILRILCVRVRKSQASSPARLSRPVKPKDFSTIETVDEAFAYMLAMPEQMAKQNCWNHAAGLAMAARSTPGSAELEALTRQL
jgi:hypothetical protein